MQMTMSPQEKGIGNGPSRRRQGHLSDMQGHLVAALGEFVGTFLFLYVAYAGHLMAMSHATDLPPGQSLSSSSVVYIALAYGFSLLVNVWAFFRISGGLFNPAVRQLSLRIRRPVLTVIQVTLGMCLAGELPWMRAPFLFVAQMLACMSAGGLVSAMFPGDIAQANTILSPETSVAQGCFIEMFFTAQLVFVVLMLAAEKSKDTFLAPIGIGLTMFVVMVAGTPITAASLNPVRSFGCAVAGRSFPGYHWIYWVGPVLGSLLAAGLFRVVKRLHYEEANKGQDDTGARNGREMA